MDVFAELDASVAAMEDAQPKTPEEEFIDWFTKGPMSRLDRCGPHIRSLKDVFHFITVDKGFMITKKINTVNGERTVVLDHKGFTRLLLDYCIQVLFHESIDHTFKGKPTLDWSKCLDGVLATTLAQTLTFDQSSILKTNLKESLKHDRQVA